VRRPPRFKQPTNLLAKEAGFRRTHTELNALMEQLVENVDIEHDDINEVEDAIRAAAIQARDKGRLSDQHDSKGRANHSDVSKSTRYGQVRRAKKLLDVAVSKLSELLKVRAATEGLQHAELKKLRKKAAFEKWKSDMDAKVKSKRKKGRGPCESVVYEQTLECVNEELPDIMSTSISIDMATLNIRAAHRDVKRARAVLHKVSATNKAKFMRAKFLKAPKDFWKAQEQLTLEAGNPVSKLNKLMQGMTDKHGKLITRDVNEIADEMVRHRRGVFAISTNLTKECEERLSEAIAAVHILNCELKESGNFHEDSVVMKLAGDPMYIQKPIDMHRLKQQRVQDLATIIEGLKSQRTHTRGMLPVFESRDTIKQKYAAECQQLNSPFTAAEVQDAMSLIQDVGSGTDSLEPFVFSMNSKGVRVDSEDFRQANSDPGRPCSTAVTATRVFNRIRKQGLNPDKWSDHRCVLHYKGKASDPHCLDNYRGLGIDQTMLKLLSLVMNERLEKFITATKGLSLSQGGFQRQKGTPEMVFTLSETVRARLELKGVHLAFIDIERAYDSVLHPLLWKACIDKGIDGSFLAMLQAIYFNATATLDVNGVLLEAVPIQCGVIQGNPLSPLLFNIYIDQVIRSVDALGHHRSANLKKNPFGIPLPCCDRTGSITTSLQSTKSDFLSQMFYADDGTLIDSDFEALQEMLNTVVYELSCIGLKVNISKTKYMYVPPFYCTKKEVEQQINNLKTLKVGDSEIERVETFEYLGVLFNMQWNWSSAWQEAIKRAESAFHAANRGGFDRTGTLNSMLIHANAKIFSHFTYIMAITGAGGCKSSAPYLRARHFIQVVLKKIAGYPFINGEALEIEAGVWDLQSRIDMLLLRFWCKIASMPHESLVYRSMTLSINKWLALNRGCPNIGPDKMNASLNQVHRQPWGQQLAAAATRFGLDMFQVMQMHTSAVVQVEVGADEKWLVVDMHNSVSVEQAYTFVRQTHGSIRLSTRGRTSRDAPVWLFPGARSNVYNALSSWSATLKEACYMSLRWRGNKQRQVKVAQFLATNGATVTFPCRPPNNLQLPNLLPQPPSTIQRQPPSPLHRPSVPSARQAVEAAAAPILVAETIGTVEMSGLVAVAQATTTLPSAAVVETATAVAATAVAATAAPEAGKLETPLRRWAMFTTISFQQPYWRSLKVTEARRFLRLRFDVGPYEHNIRRRVHVHKLHNAEGSFREVAFWRINTKKERYCYCCGISGDPSTYSAETLEHMLLKCTHPDLVTWRSETRAGFDDIAESAGIDLPRPDFNNDSVLWTTFMLCREIGIMPLLQPAAISQTDNPGIEASKAREAAQWVGSLTDVWVDCQRSRRVNLSEIDSMPGGRLVDFVVRQAMQVFVIHRRCVRNNVEYTMRRRDSPSVQAQRQRPYERKRVATRKKVSAKLIPNQEKIISAVARAKAVANVLEAIILPQGSWPQLSSAHEQRARMGKT